VKIRILFSRQKRLAIGTEKPCVVGLNVFWEVGKGHLIWKQIFLFSFEPKSEEIIF
jgi:hypothetical protein